jgi:hypothetical protein
MSAAIAVAATRVMPTAATRDLNFSISAPDTGSKKILANSLFAADKLDCSLQL